MEREQALRRQEKQERANSGYANASSEWTVLLTLPKAFCNPFAARLREDLGPLEWERGQISVLGRQVREFSNITGFSICRQMFPWFALIASNVFVIGMSLAGIYRELTPESPLTWVALAGMDILLIWSTRSTKWIRVTFQNSEGIEEDVYLLPVSSSGWRRFDGASERLLAILVEDVLRTRGEK